VYCGSGGSGRSSLRYRSCIIIIIIITIVVINIVICYTVIICSNWLSLSSPHVLGHTFLICTYSLRYGYFFIHAVANEKETSFSGCSPIYSLCLAVLILCRPMREAEGNQI
jgi:hypothetical protein